MTKGYFMNSSILTAVVADSKKAMKSLMPLVKEKTDGKLVSEIVNSKLP